MSKHTFGDVSDNEMCPKCSITWIGDPVPEEHKDMYDSDHFSINIMGVEYGYPSAERYDGISEYRCLGCNTRWGRWTGEIIPDGFCESRFGKRGVVKVEETEE
jgi:hypothetical protein